MPDQPVIALYKTFDGEEFVGASLTSIYDHVDAIVMVHSDTSWTGQKGNRVRPVVEAWQELHDYAGKIHHVEHSTTSQEEQYQAGLDYVAAAGLPHSLFLLVDCDEVWDAAHLAAAIDFARTHPLIPAFQVRLAAYIKTPFYQVVPWQGTPTVLLRDGSEAVRTPRAWKARGLTPIPNVYFHHYTHVRATTQRVLDKINASVVADKGDTLGDLDRWLAEKWGGLPHARDLHPFAGRERWWGGVQSVWLDEMPAAVRDDASIIDRYLPKGELGKHEEATLYRLAKGKRQVVDLGTFLGRSAAIFSLNAERVRTVDLFEDVAGIETVRDPTGTYAQLMQENRCHYDRVKRFLAQYGNIEVVKGRTADVAASTPDESVDLLFIDGDHSEAGVASDFFAWLPKVARGGVILFHDVNHVHPFVRQFVEEGLKSLYPRIIPMDIGDVGSLRAFWRAG